MHRPWMARSLLVTGLCLVLSAHADELPDFAQFDGPLASRDNSLFGHLRLNLRPTLPVTPRPGTWAFDTDLTYQNTWAVSKPVEDYLQTLDGRRTLGQAEVDAIDALPGENYLFDMELSQMEFFAYRQLWRHWGAFATVSAVSYGGSFDGVIEQFHTALGATDYGRESLPRGQANLVFDIAGVQSAELDARPSSGFLDPTIGFRFDGISLPAPWSLSIEGAVKVPVGGERDWLSTGKTDVGVQASVVRRGLRHALYASLGTVQYGGSSDPRQPNRGTLGSLMVGVETTLTAATHAIAQLNAGSGLYDAAQTTLSELRGVRVLTSIGINHRRGAHVFTAAVTENVGNTRNTPDFGMQLGWAYRL